MFAISSSKNKLKLTYHLISSSHTSLLFLVFYRMEICLASYLETHLQPGQNVKRPPLFWSVFKIGEFRYSRTNGPVSVAS